MVDIACDVLSGGAVDGFAVAKFKKILPTDAVCFVVAHNVTPVFNNESALGYGDIRKNAQTCSAFARHNVECGFSWRVSHKRKITAKDSRNLEKCTAGYGRSLKEKSFSIGTLKYAARR